MPYEPEWLNAERHPTDILLPTTTDIFWTEGLKRGGFGRADIAGTGVVPEWFQAVGKTMLASRATTDGSYLYWVSTEHTALARANFWISRIKLDGGGLAMEWFSLGENEIGTVRGITSDGTYLYIYHNPLPIKESNVWYIGRFHIGTKTWEPEWLTPKEEWEGGGITERPPGFALATGAGYIWWQVPGGIARARLADAGGIDENFTHRKSSKILGGVSPTGGVQSLWVQGEYVWAGCGGLIPHIYRAKLDGSLVEKINLPPSKPLTAIHVALDDVYLYWDWAGNYIGRWDLSEIDATPIPLTEEEKSDKEKKEEEEKGGGTGKEEEEEAAKGKEKEEKEKAEEEDKKQKEKEQKEKEEREEAVKEEEEREHEKEIEEGGGVIIPPPPPVTGAIVVPGVVRYGRPRE